MSLVHRLVAVVAACVAVAGFAAPVSTVGELCTVRVSEHARAGEPDSSPGVDAALDALRAAGGGTFCVDGKFRMTRPLNLDRLGVDRSVRFVGASPDLSGFVGVGRGAMVTQTDRTPKVPNSPYMGVYQYHNEWNGLSLVKAPGTRGPIFDFQTGAQVAARYVNLKLDHQGLSGVVFNVGPNHQAHNNEWHGLRVMHTTGNADQMFRVMTYHNGWNSNRIVNSTFYGRGSTGAPAVEVRPLGSGQFHHLVLDQVTFQNTDGGAFHGYAVKGGALRALAVWDTPAGGMRRDVIRLGNGVSDVVVSGLGVVVQPLGAAALARGVHMVAIGRGVSGMSVLSTSGVVWTGLAY